MLGVGVLGVAGVGILIYETVKSKAPAAGAPGTGVTAPAPVAPNIPIIPTTRPAAASGNAIFTTYPTGPVLNLSSTGTLSATPLAEQNITLVLPAGASWDAIVGGASSNQSVGLGQVQLGGDVTSPVSIAMGSLPKGINMLLAAWYDSAKTKHYTAVNLPTYVALTLHA